MNRLYMCLVWIVVWYKFCFHKINCPQNFRHFFKFYSELLSEAHYSTEVLCRLSLLSYNLDCDANLGLSNYKLPDSAITASSVRDAKVSTSEIRLNQNGWCAATKTGKNSWVQVDLLTVRFILTKTCTGLKV